MKIIIIDSKQSYIDSLTELLSNSEKYSVINSFHTLEEYTANFVDEKSIILFELSEKNIKILAELNLHNQKNWQKYVGLSIYNDSNLAGKAIVAGASSVISKSEGLEVFERTLDLIKSGSGVVPSTILNYLHNKLKEGKTKSSTNKFSRFKSYLI